MSVTLVTCPNVNKRGKTKTVARVQIGARMEKTLVKTLKALADILTSR